MRVLFVINSLILAGAEALTKDLALEFQRRGHTVEVAVLKRLNSAFEQQLEAAGIRVWVPGRGGIYSPLHVRPLRSVLAKHDVVIAMLFPATLWLALAAGRSAPPLLTSEQNTYNRRRDWRALRPLDARMYRAYAAIACASKAIQDSLCEWLPEIAPRTVVLPNAVALERFATAQPADRAALTGDPTAPLLMFTARFEPQKDHATLLRALVKVPGAHLLLAGDGPLRPAMERLAHSLGIAARVHFLGRRADVPQLLKAADLYLHSSHYEGFGIAAVEAMAAGLPVIASEVPGLSEVVRGAGILVPPGDEEALAQAMCDVLGSEERRRALAQSSLQHSRQYSIETCADRFLLLAKQAIEKHAKA